MRSNEKKFLIAQIRRGIDSANQAIHILHADGDAGDALARASTSLEHARLNHNWVLDEGNYAVFPRHH